MTIRFTRCRLPLFVLAFACLLPATHLFAQATTTGGISGSIVGGQSEPLGQVWVNARNLETGLTRGGLTRTDGSYTIPSLPPGSYEVRVSLIGYEPAHVNNVQVSAGISVSANLRLHASAINVDSVQVLAGSRSIATEEIAVTSGITGEEIDQLPSLSRNFNDFITLAGAVSPFPENTIGGQFSIGGQRPSQTNVQIDGVDGNNAFYGDIRAGTRIPFSFPLESVREIQVITNGYDVEYGRYTGGIINVVTKGGGNTVEGTLFGNVRNKSQVTQYGGRLSGPVLRDRLHYMFALGGQRRREPFIPLAPERYLSSGDTAGFAALNRFHTILAGRYGVRDAATLYQPFETSNDVVTLFGRLDYSGSVHRILLRHSFSKFTNANEPGSETFSGGLSAVERYETRSNSLVGELQSMVGASSFNILRFQLASEHRPRTAAEQRPELQVVLPGGELARYGGHQVAYQNRFEEAKLQVADNFSHQSGNHAFKLGGALVYTRIANQFGGAQAAGSYRFNSLNDFENYLPVSYVRRLRSDGSIPSYRFSVLEWALYAQHEWRATPHLTTLVGVRYDVERFVDAPRSIADVEREFGVRTGFAPTDADNISPRIALTYDIHGDRTLIAHAGAGYFYGSVPYALGGSVMNTERPVGTLTCRGSIVAGAADAPPDPRGYAAWDVAGGTDNPESCSAFSGLGGIPEYNLWGENFEFPEIFKANVGLQRRVTTGTRIIMNLAFARAFKLYTVSNLNLGDPKFTLAGEGARQVFTPPQHFTPASGAAQTNHRRNAQFSNVLVNGTAGTSEAILMTTELRQRMGKGTMVRAVYTFSRAHDNSSFSCCSQVQGFTNARLGAYGPNDIGSRGDESRGWGESDFNRPHTLVLAAVTRLPYRFRVSGSLRVAEGTPWTAEATGDLNGDGINYNDRPFIFAPEHLPVDRTLNAAQQQVHRDRYDSFLTAFPCVGSHVGQIIPRNTCRNPTYKRLDASLGYSLPSPKQHHAEIVLDIFNVLNLLNNDWGRYHGIPTERRALLEPRAYVGGAAGSADGMITYRVPATFGETRELGTNLMLQWHLQLSARYRF